MNIINLSYLLSEDTPSYGSKHKFIASSEKSILNNDSSNSYILSFLNHIGTHIDAPNHFHKNGKKISDFSAEDLIFHKPQIIDIDLTISNEISHATLVDKINIDSDVVFFRTFFGKKRHTSDYINSYPVFSSKLAFDLKSNFPKIKSIGLDIISLTSPLNREEGTKSHQILRADDSREILIIEDMNLSVYEDKIDKIMVVPLMVKDVDSAPCTVYGIY